MTVLDKLHRGNCAALAAGGAVSLLTAASPDIVRSALTLKEYQLARLAVEYACHRRGDDPKLSDQIAVRLLKIAQCHNTNAVDFIENNQNHIRAALGRKGGCRAD